MDKEVSNQGASGVTSILYYAENYAALQRIAYEFAYVVHKLKLTSIDDTSPYDFLRNI